MKAEPPRTLSDPPARELARLRGLALAKSIWVTAAVISANVLVFVILVSQGMHFMTPGREFSFVDWGGNFGPLTLGGEPQRLLTSMFLHAGILHIGFNMYVLFGLGRLVEQLYGHTAFAFLYLLSGLAGSVASLYFHPTTVSVGASGAVFGIFGGLCGYLLRQHRTMPPGAVRALRSMVITFIAYAVLVALAIPNVDAAAHGGGFAAGVFGGLVMAAPLSPAGKATRRVRIPVFVFVCGVIIAALFLRLPPVAAAADQGTHATFGAAMTEITAARAALMERYRAATTEHHEGRLEGDALAATIDDEILPGWNSLIRRIDQLPRGEMNAAEADLKETLRQAMALRREALTLQSESLREGAPAKLETARERERQANDLILRFNRAAEALSTPRAD